MGGYSACGDLLFCGLGLNPSLRKEGRAGGAKCCCVLVREWRVPDWWGLECARCLTCTHVNLVEVGDIFVQLVLFR